jgi:site-specific recombinase XerD
MNKKSPNILACALRDFFGEYLPSLRGLSPHTVLSYRDALILWLRFLASDKNISLTTLDLPDIQPQDAIAFLLYLEQDRHNCVATRNIRLAAIHAFFRYVGERYPEQLDQAQQMLAIPFKRTSVAVIDYFDYEEIKVILESIDRSVVKGRRDYALLAMMFNTGARVQEIIDLQVADIQFVRPFQVRLLGKGRKTRICPLWSQTVQVLRDYVRHDRGLDLHDRHPLFINHRGAALTRFGIRYILNKRCETAMTVLPTLAAKSLHPHSMRHSTAVHLLKSGVDLATISHWLGHASLNTTNRYATIDLEMKRKAIELIESPSDGKAGAWRTDETILGWLESL